MLPLSAPDVQFIRRRVFRIVHQRGCDQTLMAMTFLLYLKLTVQELRSETVAPFEWGQPGTPNSSETLGLTIGDHTLEAIVTDAKGLSTTISKTITVDRITAVSSLLDRKALLVFSNPSKEGLFHLSEALEYRVLNAGGAVILKGFGDIIDLSNASEGIYLLKADGDIIQLIK